jgi:hypothetical protein
MSEPQVFRVIVAGSRSCVFAGLVARHLDHLLRKRLPDVLVVSGGAAGADMMGEQWALSREVPYRRFPADWQRHGRRAGPIRNGEMLAFAREVSPLCGLVAFWDGSSRGTADMIEQANAAGIPIRVIRFDPATGQEAEESA